MRYGVWVWEYEVWGVSMRYGCGYGSMRYGVWVWVWEYEVWGVGMGV